MMLQKLDCYMQKNQTAGLLSHAIFKSKLKMD